MSQIEMKKETKYTISSAKHYISADLKPEDATDIFIFHVLSNDIMTKATDVCFQELKDLVQVTVEKLPSCKIIISLATNRCDSEISNLKVNCINALIREQYYNKTTIHIADNDVLAVHGQVIPRFIGQDGRHLSNEGIKVIAANLRSAVENVLKIGTYRRRRYADRSEHYGNYFSRQVPT